MAAQNPGSRRRRAAALLAGVLLGALSAPCPVRAQAPGPVPEYYSRQREFKIPFTEPGDRRVQQVFLYVSENGGAWQRSSNANPSGRFFLFTAPHDGWFSFTTQTQDSDGRFVPADPREFQPLEKVCVDTLKPVINLRQVSPREGSVAVEWDVQDANLDVMSLRIEYRPWGSRDVREWLPLAIPAIARGEKSWTPPLNIPLEVYMAARDKAGNTAEQTLQVVPGRTAPGGPAPPTAPPLRHVKTREFQLGCTITNQGESGVQGIDVYVLRDNVWQKFTPDPKQCKILGDKAICAVKVQSNGRWGFTLIPRSGVGLANPPPRPGDPPQIWIEVDETKPVVSIDNVVVGQGQDLGRLSVYWTASDVHLGPKPITLYYGSGKDGPWTPLAKGLENTRVYTVDTRSLSPRLPFEFYLKVEAVDEAGNVGSAVTPNTVKIDTKIPTPSGVDVIKPGEAPASSPPENPMTPGEQ
jgi:hypothetical protein